MLGRLALFFLLIPVLELYLLIQAGIWVGNGWFVIALVFLTGVGRGSGSPSYKGSA